MPEIGELDVCAQRITLISMTGTTLLTLKQQLTKLSERERREVSVFLIRLGQENLQWKKETARRLKEMDAGKKTSAAELRKRLADGK